MGFGISLPSLSDIRNSVTQTVDSARESLRDFGEGAAQRASDLGRAGLDIGRQGVEAVRDFDVREAAATVREGIGSATEAGRQGLSDAVAWSSERVGDAADYARSNISGDDPFSQAARGLITTGENVTRFQIGATGGILREVVGTVGAVGQLGTTLTEMQLSPEARLEYGQQITDFATSTAGNVAGYAQSVAADPGRLVTDAGNAWDGAGGFVSGQLDRYGQAIAEGRGAETIGMDVGTVATYVVPVGGGPARGAITGAVREGTEAVVREGTEAVVRGAARNGDEAVDIVAASQRSGAETAVFRDPMTGGQTVTAGSAISEAQGAARGAGDIPSFTFRGDSRPPEVIFNEGFAPRGTSTDLYAHALDNTNPPSFYVSTSRSPDVAAQFNDNVYVVRPTSGIDVNATLGPSSPFPNELEIALPGHVPTSDIRGLTLPNEGRSIINPNYVP